MSYKPRFDLITKKATDLLLELDLTDFSTPVFKIVDEYGIRLLPYSCIETQFPEIIKKYPTLMCNLNKCAGLTIKVQDIDYILYNDCDSYERIRFTISHEICHIFNHGSLPSCTDEYNQWEIEAEFFGAQLLMPIEALIVLNMSCSLNVELVSNLFHVSKLAAKKRINHFYNYRDFIKTVADWDLLEIYYGLSTPACPTNPPAVELVHYY